MLSQIRKHSRVLTTVKLVVRNNSVRMTYAGANLTLVCVIAVVAFRRTVRKRRPMSDQVIDHDGCYPSVLAILRQGTTVGENRRMREV